MPVSVIFSATNGGSALDQPFNYGSSANGEITTVQTVYIRHDGSASITSCALYLNTFSDTYGGDATAALDYDEIKAWGDAVTASAFGGIQINQNATGSFPASSWPTYASHISTDGLGAVFNNAQGSSSLNAIGLQTETGAIVDGEIQAGSSPNVRFQTKAQVPTAEDVTGVREWDLVLRFSYTS